MVRLGFEGSHVLILPLPSVFSEQKISPTFAPWHLYSFVSLQAEDQQLIFSSNGPVVHANIPYDVVGEDDTLYDDEDEDAGECVWYGQCGPGWNPETNLNCPVTNATKHGPKLTDKQGLDILKKYCPDWYHGKFNPLRANHDCSRRQILQHFSTKIRYAIS